MIRRWISISVVIMLMSVTCTCVLAQATFEEPVLLTSAGQSADVTMANALCKKAGLSAEVKSLASPDDLKGVKTLALVAGFSSKGLGAAGISREQEMKRVEGLIAEAKKSGVRILTLHIGGSARRGNQSDDFNTLAAQSAHHLIVVQQGDEDGFFSGIATKRKIPIDLVEKIAGAVQPLKKVFGK